MEGFAGLGRGFVVLCGILCHLGVVWKLCTGVAVSMST